MTGGARSTTGARGRGPCRARRRAACLAIVLGCAAASPALACGVCIEDKMAATYDDATVRRSLAQGRLVVFFDVKGALEAADLQRTARAVAGVQGDTVRVSVQPMALSFAIDPRVQTPERAQRHLASLLGAPSEVRLIRTLGPP